MGWTSSFLEVIKTSNEDTPDIRYSRDGHYQGPVAPSPCLHTWNMEAEKGSDQKTDI